MSAFRLLVLAAPVLLVAGCNTTQTAAPPAAPPAQASASITPPGFKLPEGAGCSGEIARYRAIQDNDLRMGHVGKSVYDQIQGEIAQAESACSAGRDGEARGLIAASRKRHGYPA